MDERRRLGVELVLDGRRVASETRYGEVGAYVLVLCTCVSDLGVELHSAYVGHPGTSTHVTHLALSGPPSQAASETAVYPGGDLPWSSRVDAACLTTCSGCKTSWAALDTKRALTSTTPA